MHYESENLPVAGLAMTASLATDRPKRGSHRVHLRVQTIEQTATLSLVLAKGERSRVEEEAITTRMVLNFVAEACALPDRLELGLRAGEAALASRQMAPPPWRELLLGHTEKVRQGPASAAATRVLFPGAFNPLHAGHRRMAELAAEIVGAPVEFEMTILNVDKPPLDYVEIERRLVQFGASETVWLTRTPTFVEKSTQFPGATFVVGADTIRRIAEPRYYGGNVKGRDAAIEEIARRGCRFLVFGRALGKSLQGWKTSICPSRLQRSARKCRQSSSEPTCHRQTFGGKAESGGQITDNYGEKTEARTSFPSPLSAFRFPLFPVVLVAASRPLGQGRAGASDHAYFCRGGPPKSLQENVGRLTKRRPELLEEAPWKIPAAAQHQGSRHALPARRSARRGPRRGRLPGRVSGAADAHAICGRRVPGGTAAAETVAPRRTRFPAPAGRPQRRPADRGLGARWGLVHFSAS